ncbi:hypothetical protein PM082_007273 [Marasmius tenuissimus]|nr:hypothetical protein PM082_007273 [Marasmius tenuissimus]
MKCLKQLVDNFQTLPQSLFLHDIKRDGIYPLTGGGSADIYRGTVGGKPVCLKVLRVHTTQSGRRRKQLKANFCKEALLWAQLRHANLLPLLGVNTRLFPSGFCLVSPWMEHGDITAFLKENPGHDKTRALYEIVSGLQYLHSLSPPVVHGDIKGANILVDECHRCLLADFGLADSLTTMLTISSGDPKGSLRWMAPEMFRFSPTTEVDVEGHSRQNGVTRHKSPRDIYAFACTVLEIMTGEPPFPNVGDVAVISLVSTGVRPERPSKGWCPNNIWELVETCWCQDPLQRPRAEELQDRLQKLMEAGDSSSPVDPPFMGHFHPDGIDPSPPVPLNSLSPGNSYPGLPQENATSSTLHVSGVSVQPPVHASSASPQRHSPPISSGSNSSSSRQHSNNTSHSSSPPSGLPLWRGRGGVLMSGDNSHSLRRRAMDAISSGYRTIPSLFSRIPPSAQVVSIIICLVVRTSNAGMMAKTLVSIVTLGLCWEHVVFLAQTVFRKITSWFEGRVGHLRDLDQGYTLVTGGVSRPRWSSANR